MASAIPTLDIRRFTAPSSSSDRAAFVAELPPGPHIVVTHAGVIRVLSLG